MPPAHKRNFAQQVECNNLVWEVFGKECEKMMQERSRLVSCFAKVAFQPRCQIRVVADAKKKVNKKTGLIKLCFFFLFILHSESLYLSNPVGLEIFAFFQPRAVVKKDVVTSQGHQELEQVSDVRTDGIYKKKNKDPHIRKRCFLIRKGFTNHRLAYRTTYSHLLHFYKKTHLAVRRCMLN